MAPFIYESLEDGQTIAVDEPREDLDVLARWVRTEVTAEEAQRRADESSPSGDGGDAGDSDPARPELDASTEDWAAFAKHPAAGLDVADDAGRDAIIAAYIEKFAPAGNASGKEWADYAAAHGVTVDEKDGRDKIRAAVVDAGWATA